MSLIRRISPFFLGLCCVFLVAASARADGKTQIHLLLSADAARAGDTVWAGLQMEMPAGWHTYWRNGGDAGQPTEIKWSLPAGVTAGEIQWPIPEKETDSAGDSALITYVYTNQVILLFPLTLDKSVAAGTVNIAASAKWMECSPETCVFGGGDASAQLIIGDTAKRSASAAILDRWRTNLPSADNSGGAAAYWSGAPGKDGVRDLVIDWKTNALPADFFPDANTNFQVLGPTQTTTGPNGSIRLLKSVKKSGGDWPKQITGILVGNAGKPDSFALEERLEVQAAAPAAPPSAARSGVEERFLLPILMAAFLGGLILNVMPCVLPVIALKILGFVNQSHEEPAQVRKLGLVYGLGVLVSFLILAALAILAQRAGGVASWGDLFRNPNFQLAMTILMTLIALNLFGVFEITLSGKALGAASGLSAKPGFSGAFFNGVLATILATPCTAPFLGTALGFALTQPPFTIALVFLAAGFGLALPFVLLCFFPRALKFLPKPGAWMEKFKNLMGFPMLATVVWLVWVSSTLDTDPLWLGLFLLVLSLACWIWGQFVQRGSKGKPVAVAICVVLVAADYIAILKGEVHQKSAIEWQAWSPEAVEAARRAGHPVFVDFTAKSCITCNVNLGTSIDIPSTRAKLKQIGAVTLKADDTLNDPAIARELRKYHTSGVPLVLVYSKNLSEEPQVLPAILSPSIVINALNQADKP
jgi:thiol:disulfide interchange protein DsbD